jgi:hypothetical protein
VQQLPHDPSTARRIEDDAALARDDDARVAVK